MTFVVIQSCLAAYSSMGLLWVAVGAMHNYLEPFFDQAGQFDQCHRVRWKPPLPSSNLFHAQRLASDSRKFSPDSSQTCHILVFQYHKYITPRVCLHVLVHSCTR